MFWWAARRNEEQEARAKQRCERPLGHVIRSVGQGVAAVSAIAVAFAVLAGLVSAGALTALDQYGVDHLMRNLNPKKRAPTVFSSDLFHIHLGSPLATFCNIWSFPASVLVSALVLLACCTVLIRRGERGAALLWAGAWLAANLVEVIGKSLLQRPTLDATADGVRAPFHSFDSSFPSGHSSRSLLIALLLASLWRRALWPALLWVLGVLGALVVNAAHVPSDIVGGLLVGLLAILAVQIFLRVSPRLGYLGADRLVDER